MNIYLEIFLFVDVFIAGAALTLALSHAYAHLHPHAEVKTGPKTPKEIQLAKEARERLLAQAEGKYRRILNDSAEQLTQDLNLTIGKISDGFKKMTDDILKQEQQGFLNIYENYKQTAQGALDTAKDQSDSFKKELKDKLEQDVEEERQRLVALIDNKLSDAIMSFLTEAMQHEVDLGAQEDYLMELLDKHKEEFKQAIST